MENEWVGQGSWVGGCLTFTLLCKGCCEISTEGDWQNLRFEAVCEGKSNSVEIEGCAFYSH